ncbi:MAG: hypothetical protein Q9212_007212 [Teloschistes hypoglaucus]
MDNDKQASDVEHFPFFDLPREMRDLIYGFAMPMLLPSQGTYPTMVYSITESAEFPIISEEDFSLFQVSQQMRSESVEIFYKDTCAIISVNQHGKSLISTECSFVDFYPLQAPSWAFAMRNWQIVLTPDRLSAGRIPAVGGWNQTDNFRDACNFLSRVENLESLTVILPCGHGHETEQVIETKAVIHTRRNPLAGDYDPSQDAWRNLERAIVEFYTTLKVLLRQLQAKNGINIEVACHQPECMELLQKADQAIDLKQASEPRLYEEEDYEILKHRAAHILDRVCLGELFCQLAQIRYHWLVIHYGQNPENEGYSSAQDFLIMWYQGARETIEAILDPPGHDGPREHNSFCSCNGSHHRAPQETF